MVSVLDEHEAHEVLDLIVKDSRAAGSVWGDIYRNRFLESLRDVPSSLTPAGDFINGEAIFHGSIMVETLKKSNLWESLIPPEKRRLHGSMGVV